MDNHTQAWHYVLHYRAFQILGDFEFRTDEEVLSLWNEIANVYEEILPQLTDPSHIQLIKDALDATKANVEADKKGNVSNYDLMGARFDFFNAVNVTTEAIQFLKKNNRSYEAKYPDVRPPEDDEQVLEIPILAPAVHKKMTEERVLQINDKG